MPLPGALSDSHFARMPLTRLCILGSALGVLVTVVEMEQADQRQAFDTAAIRRVAELANEELSRDIGTVVWVTRNNLRSLQKDPSFQAVYHSTKACAGGLLVQ